MGLQRDAHAVRPAFAAGPDRADADHGALAGDGTLLRTAGALDLHVLRGDGQYGGNTRAVGSAGLSVHGRAREWRWEPIHPPDGATRGAGGHQPREPRLDVVRAARAGARLSARRRYSSGRTAAVPVPPRQIPSQVGWPSRSSVRPRAEGFPLRMTQRTWSGQPEQARTQGPGRLFGTRRCGATSGPNSTHTVRPKPGAPP